MSRAYNVIKQSIWGHQIKGYWSCPTSVLIFNVDILTKDIINNFELDQLTVPSTWLSLYINIGENLARPSTSATKSDWNKHFFSRLNQKSQKHGHHSITSLPCSQKAAFVQPQLTPIEHWRESCTTRLAVLYYPIFLIERRNIWPINLCWWKDQLLSSLKCLSIKNSSTLTIIYGRVLK